MRAKEGESQGRVGDRVSLKEEMSSTDIKEAPPLESNHNANHI